MYYKYIGSARIFSNLYPLLKAMNMLRYKMNKFAKKTRLLTLNEESDARSKIERDYDQLLEEYIDSKNLKSETKDSSVLSPNLRRSKLKEQIKADTQPRELLEYLKIAFNALRKTGIRHLLLNQYDAMLQQLSRIRENLNKIDFHTPIETNYRTLLHFDDDTIKCILKIAQGEYNDDHLEESMSLFALLALLEPANAELWYRLGITAYRAKRFEFALHAFTNASTIDTDLVGSKVFSADCHLNLSNAKEAKIALEEALELIDKNGEGSRWLEMIKHIKVKISKN